MAIKAVLAGIAAATAVVGGVMASRSYRQAAQTEEQVGEYNKSLAERDAKIKEQEAREGLQLRALQSQDEDRAFADLQASTELALSHNGWMLNEGTPVLQLAYNADQFEEQQRRNDYAARTQERATMDAAVQDRMRGQLERTMGYQRGAALGTQATGSLLGGFGNAAKIWMTA